MNAFARRSVGRSLAVIPRDPTRRWSRARRSSASRAARVMTGASSDRRRGASPDAQVKWCDTVSEWSEMRCLRRSNRWQLLCHDPREELREWGFPQSQGGGFRERFQENMRGYTQAPGRFNRTGTTFDVVLIDGEASPLPPPPRSSASISRRSNAAPPGSSRPPVRDRVRKKTERSYHRRDVTNLPLTALSRAPHRTDAIATRARTRSSLTRAQGPSSRGTTSIRRAGGD